MNEAHIRAIASTMMQLDEVLEGVDAIAEGRESATVFYRKHNSYTPAERDRLRALITRVRTRMEALRERLAFTPEERTARHLVWCHCAVVSDYLEEVSGTGLLRYGAPNPAEADAATKEMRRIQGLLRDIAELASDNRVSDQAPQSGGGEVGGPHGRT